MLVRAVFAVVLLLLPAAAFAQTEKRIALVIGNQSYAREVGVLNNPYKDIRVVGAALAKVGFETTTDFFLNLQVWGTPEQCFEKIMDIRSKVGCSDFTGVFCYGGMPFDEAERNIRTFASDVMPRLQNLKN